MNKVSVQELFSFLCTLAPVEQQMDFDNSGFLLGRGEAVVKRVLLALDVSSEVIGEAIDKQAELIISHHPLIFHAIQSVTDGKHEQEKLLRLIENHIAVISMHTNLDIADGGVNDVLLSLFGLTAESPLDEDGCGRIGTFPEALSMAEFLPRCKALLKTRGLRYYDAGRPVKRLAVMGGSGGSSLERAAALGCDTYLTADIKYDQFLTARELGLNLIDGDHFCTENPVIEVLAAKLRQAFPQLEFLISERHSQTASFL